MGYSRHSRFNVVVMAGLTATLISGCGSVDVSAPGTNVHVGMDGVHVAAPFTNVDVGAGGVHVAAPFTNVDVGGGGVRVAAPFTNVAVGGGGRGLFPGAPGAPGAPGNGTPGAPGMSTPGNMAANGQNGAGAGAGIPGLGQLANLIPGLNGQQGGQGGAGAGGNFGAQQPTSMGGPAAQPRARNRQPRTLSGPAPQSLATVSDGDGGTLPRGSGAPVVAPAGPGFVSNPQLPAPVVPGGGPEPVLTQTAAAEPLGAGAGNPGTLGAPIPESVPLPGAVPFHAIPGPVTLTIPSATVAGGVDATGDPPPELQDPYGHLVDPRMRAPVPAVALTAPPGPTGEGTAPVSMSGPPAEAPPPAEHHATVSDPGTEDLRSR